jgi:hypothetical protein
VYNDGRDDERADNNYQRFQIASVHSVGFPFKQGYRPKGANSCSCHRLTGPVFRFGRNPIQRLFLSRIITNVGIRAITGRHRHEPATRLAHLRTEFWLLTHQANMRFKSAAIKLTHYHLSDEEV